MNSRKILIFLIIIIVISIGLFLFYSKIKEEKKEIPELEEGLSVTTTPSVKSTRTEVSPIQEYELSRQEKEELGINPDTQVTLKTLSAEESGLGAPTKIITIHQEKGPEDADNDGLSDEEEKKLGTNPLKRDTDGDGLDDKDEIQLKINPLNSDTDGDGISDSMEIKQGTDPLKIDTDGDGIPDGEEIKKNSDTLIISF